MELTKQLIKTARNELIEYLKPISSCENENCRNRTSSIRHFHEIFATRKTIMRVDDPLVHAWVYLFLPNIAILCEECHLYKLPSREYFYELKRKKDFMPAQEFIFLISFCRSYKKIIESHPDLRPISNGVNKLFEKFDEFKQQGLLKTTLSRPKNYEF